MAVKTLQERAEQFREGRFLGVPIDGFEDGGREQLLILLQHGLTPESKVLDIGCGVLRAGYWLIHFLQPGCYCGIEPSAERLGLGIERVLSPQTGEAKRPRFDTNANFDTSVFGETFDVFLAYSIWTHASKRQIRTMLDGFARDSAAGGIFLTTFLPAKSRSADYDGDAWVGTSHESESAGCIRHRLDWVREECARRELSVTVLGVDTIQGQTWLKIRRGGDRVVPATPLGLQPRWLWIWRRALRRLRR